MEVEINQAVEFGAENLTALINNPILGLLRGGQARPEMEIDIRAQNEAEQSRRKEIDREVMERQREQEIAARVEAEIQTRLQAMNRQNGGIVIQGQPTGQPTGQQVGTLPGQAPVGYPPNEPQVALGAPGRYSLIPDGQYQYQEDNCDCKKCRKSRRKNNCDWHEVIVKPVACMSDACYDPCTGEFYNKYNTFPHRYRIDRKCR